MLSNAQLLASEYGMLPGEGGLVLCAVSGGADSMCLLRFLADCGRRRGFSVAAAHFNHMLRGEEALRDAAFTQAYCQKRGLPFYLGSGDVRGEARRAGRGIEETARAMRYAFLEKTADALGADRVATAHNADDNAETLLMNLVRGSGLQGLTGIPPRRGRLVRPFLTTTRAEIEAYAQRHEIPFVEDSTNADTEYTRNKIRRQVMPILQSINPRFTEAAAAAIRTLRADNDCLNARAAEIAGQALWAKDDLVIRTELVARQPNAVAPRVVRRVLEQMEPGWGGLGAHLNAVVELARGENPSGSVDLPGGLVVRRVCGELLFTAGQDPLEPFLPVALRPGQTVQAAGTSWKIECVKEECPAEYQHGDSVFYIKWDTIQGPVWARPRQTGDALTLPGRDRKTVKKLMIDGKVPRLIRDRVPVLADGAGVIALAGFGPEQARLARPGEKALAVVLAHTDMEWGLSEDASGHRTDSL